MSRMASAVSAAGKPRTSIAHEDATSQEAIVIVRPFAARLRSLAVADPGEREVRVRLQGCGISEWHLPLWEGRPWFNYPQEAGAPGHEGWGFVDAIGAGIDDLDVGQRVAVLSGHAYAQFDIASRDCVIPLPEELDDEPFPGDAFARAMNVFERSDIRPGHTVAIVGAGFVGLLLTQLAADRGAHVVVLSRHRYELEFADAMDAEEGVVIRADGHDAERILRSNAGAGFDRVIEVAGTRAAVDLARQLCGEQGRVVIAGCHPYPRVTARHVKGSEQRNPMVVDMEAPSRASYVDGAQKAIQAALEGRLDPFPLMSHTVSLGSLETGFQLMRERPDGFVKALLLHET